MAQVANRSKASEFPSKGMETKFVEFADRDFIVTRCCSPVIDTFDDLYDTGFHISRHIRDSRYYNENYNPAVYWISDKLKKNEFTLKYTLKDKIDEGTYASVYKCSPNRSPNTIYAVKIVNKAQMVAIGLGSYMTREIDILRNINDGPNICKLIDFIETSTHYYLVMEYLSGGTLEKDRDIFEESEYKNYIYQVALALKYLHSNGIFHSDLQLGNICKYSRDVACFKVKLIDFGLSGFISMDKYYTPVGNMYYHSPEMLNGNGYHGPEVDVWALGVCLFKLATGFKPFKNSECIKEGKLLFSLDDEDVSDEFKDLIQSIFQIDPLLRPTIDDILKHPFFDSCRND